MGNGNEGMGCNQVEVTCSRQGLPINLHPIILREVAHEIKSGGNICLRNQQKQHHVTDKLQT